jgi:hypothetical protein
MIGWILILTRRLAQLKFDKQIEAYWTSDGRIFVKRTETSRKEIVTNFDDKVNTNIQYQIVGVYWRNNSTSFIDWYFDVVKAQAGSRKYCSWLSDALGSPDVLNKIIPILS